MKYLKIIIPIVIIISAIGFIFYINKEKNNIVCSYETKNEDYKVIYTDSFIYDDETLNNITHTIEYIFDDNTSKNIASIYNYYTKEYSTYKDIKINGYLNDNSIKFEFVFDLDKTDETKYYNLLGITKRYVLNVYKDDLIKDYKEDHTSSTCKLK